MTDTSKMRSEFEAWVLNEYPNQSLERFNPLHGVTEGEYTGFTVQHCWKAWQASRQAVVVELPPALRGLVDADGVEPNLETPDELAELREQVGGLQAVGSMQAKALKALIFNARTSGGTAGPDEGLMKACEEGGRAISLGGVGQAYMAGANAVMDKEQSHD